jgi:hypothetical protein
LSISPGHLPNSSWFRQLLCALGLRSSGFSTAMFPGSGPCKSVRDPFSGDRQVSTLQDSMRTQNGGAGGHRHGLWSIGACS